MTNASLRWKAFLVLLASLLLLSVPLWADDDDWGEGDDDRRSSSFFGGEGYEGGEGSEAGEALGNVALLGFVALNALYYYSMGFKRAPKAVRTSSPSWVKQPLKWKNATRSLHYWGNPVLIGIAWLHGITAGEGNVLVWAGWGLMVLLALSGLIMKLQRADAPGAKVNRLIHSQHVLSIVMVLLLWVGHGFLD